MGGLKPAFFILINYGIILYGECFASQLSLVKTLSKQAFRLRMLLVLWTWKVTVDFKKAGIRTDPGRQTNQVRDRC